MKTRLQPLAMMVLFIGLTSTALFPACSGSDTQDSSTDSTSDQKVDCTANDNPRIIPIKPKDTIDSLKQIHAINPINGKESLPATSVRKSSMNVRTERINNQNIPRKK